MNFFWFTAGTVVGCILTTAVFGWLFHKAPEKKEAFDLTALALIQAEKRKKSAPVMMEVRR